MITEFKIKADGVFGEVILIYRIKRKELNGVTGWDIWRAKRYNNGWDKLTRGNKIIPAITIKEVIDKLLLCNDYTFSRELISVETV